MNKIDVDELCYVNGKIGTWDEKKKIAVVSGLLMGRGAKDYITTALNHRLTTTKYGNGADVKIQPFTKAEKRDFQYEVDKAWDKSDEELLDMYRAEVYSGN